MFFSNLLLSLSDWVHYALRMVHLVAGVMWIGNSFYFMWLDSSLTVPEPKRDGVESELWMVHSGGFYCVERRRIEVGSFPSVLHWFKWEATFTWISGFLLLGWLYYLHAALTLVEPGRTPFLPGGAVAASILTLLGSWYIYDGLWRTPWAKAKPEAASLLSFGLICALIGELFWAFPGKAAFIHLGAVFGTIMVTNVWVHILPSQQQMIDATREGRQPNYELSKVAKRRSTHNSYMTLPVLLVMISNHFATAFGSAHSAWILLLLVLLGGGIRHWMIKGMSVARWLVPLLLLLVAALVDLTLPSGGSVRSTVVPFSEVKQIVSQRCVVCHSAHPLDATFGPTPGGVSFEDPVQIQRLAPRILIRAVQTKTMPLANKTQITDAERDTLGSWIAQGAKND